MTDSMKFGPEWLRNMSSDGSNIGIGGGNNSNGGGGGGGIGLGMNHIGMPSNINNNNNNNINSNINLNAGGTLSTSGTAPIGPRYPLAEFRYGREELLSLFDKNCKKPEVLSAYRKLYIDKVQCPLALTPSTDEEVPVVAPQTVTRPWMLRSPVGGTQRVAGRCGSVERGRIRPRGAFHTMFQRPTPMYEEEIRGMKTERGWPERNGTEIPPTAEWNGSPSSSPRREFSSHARNMENWRKGRVDEEAGSGGGAGGGMMVGDGWRTANQSGGGNGATVNPTANYRWSRSTSWREDEPGGETSSSTAAATAPPLQHSYSNIATTATERSLPANSGGGGPPNLLAKSASADNNASVGNKTGWEPEDLLPEWAMENPTDTGGSFDATGAFHGSNDEDDDVTSTNRHYMKQQQRQVRKPIPTVVEVQQQQLKQQQQLQQQQQQAMAAAAAAELEAAKKAEIIDHVVETNHVKADKPPLAELSDRMQEVADDMVEKLIMDDDSAAASSKPICSAPSPCGVGGAPSSVPMLPIATALLQQQQPGLIRANSTPVPPQLSQPVQSTVELWFYRDPQSKVQGPFTANEMAEWYRAGYFDENLYVRRACDHRFAALGELVKVCGNTMPFLASHLIPPLLADEPPAPPPLPQPVAAAKMLGMPESAAAAAAMEYNLQAFHKQYIMRTQAAIYAKLSTNGPFNMLSAEQQQHLVHQQMLQIAVPDYLVNPAAAAMAANSDALYNPLQQAMKAAAMKPLAESVKPLPPPQQPQSAPVSGIHRPPMSMFMNSGDYAAAAQAQAQHSLLLQQQHQQQQQASVAHATVVDLQDAIQHHDVKPSEPSDWHHHHGGSGRNINEWAQRQQQQQPPPNQWQMAQQSAAALAAVSTPMALPTPAVTAPTPIVNMWDFGPMHSAGVGSNGAAAVKPDLHTEIEILKETIMQKEAVAAATAAASLMQTYVDQKPTTTTPVVASASLQPIIAAAVLHRDLEAEMLAKQPEAEKFMAIKKNGKPKLTPSEKKKQLTEEERRREAAEEKRKQRDEKKRLQLEEEKKRIVKLEEEKQRQLLEEKERQNEIDAHRRKAMIDTVLVRNKTKQERVQSSVAPWSTSVPSTPTPGPSLADIQKAERRERRAEEQQRMLEITEKQNKSLQANEVREATLKWHTPPMPVKSLAEIQAEEARRLALEQAAAAAELLRRKELEPAAQAGSVAFNANPFASLWNNSRVGGVGTSNNMAWNGASASIVGATSPAAAAAAVVASSAPKAWGSTTSNAGFWEEPAKPAAIAPSVIVAARTNNGGVAVASAQRGLSKSQSWSWTNVTPSGGQQHAAKSGKTAKTPAESASNNNDKNKKTKKEVVSVGGAAAAASTVATSSANNNLKKDDYRGEFTNWCTKSLSSMNSKVDVPTFISFLQDIESPYEVKDYIRMYLGESKEWIEFSKQFLERRSKYKNLQRAQNAHIDDMCQPAPAINPAGNDFMEVKGKGKKIKKSKMTKLDARILGFSVTAAQDRINVGDRDYGDAS